MEVGTNWAAYCQYWWEGTKWCGICHLEEWTFFNSTMSYSASFSTGGRAVSADKPSCWWWCLHWWSNTWCQSMSWEHPATSCSGLFDARNWMAARYLDDWLNVCVCLCIYMCAICWTAYVCLLFNGGEDVWTCFLIYIHCSHLSSRDDYCR